MSDRRPSYHRRITRPRPRSELAPVAHPALPPPPETRPAVAESESLARAAEDAIATMVRCPLCAASGMVPPEIASTFEELTSKAKEQA